MNRGRQALQFCLDSAVVVVIQIFNEFLLELLYGFKFVHFNFLDGVYRSCRDYYCLRSPKSRYGQCFQWFSGNSEKMDNLAENRRTIENTAFYQNGSENSGSNIAPDKPYPYVKKQDANSCI